MQFSETRGAIFVQHWAEIMPLPSASLVGSSFWARGRSASTSCEIWSSVSVGAAASCSSTSDSVMLPPAAEDAMLAVSMPVILEISAWTSGSEKTVPTAWKSPRQVTPASVGRLSNHHIIKQHTKQ